MKIGKYKISNTNGNAYARDAVRVYEDGLKIAEVFPPSQNPLGYIRRHPGSKYRLQLVEQLKSAGVPLAIILMIVQTDNIN